MSGSLAHSRLLSQLSFLKSGSVESFIIAEKNRNTCTITINRPKQLNAFNVSMVETMIPLLKEIEASEKINVVLFQGEGRAFSAGADIKVIADMTTYPSGRKKLEYFVDIYFKMTYIIGTMKVPFISFIDGLTFGSACSFSALSHFSIATENTKISFPETRIGHFCDAGSNFFLSRLNGSMGKYLALTAKTLIAEDVLFSGIATHFVYSSQLPYIKQSLVDLDNPSYNTIREVIEKYSVKPNHIPISYTLHGERRKIVDSCFQFDTVTEILQALHKEGSTFSLETSNQINRGSPISIALTLEQLRIGSNLSLAQCLIMENKSWKVGPFDRDFREGVYSTLGKERVPQWSRTNSSAVDFKRDILDRYINADIEQTLYLEGEEREICFNAPYQRRGLPTEDEVAQAKCKNNLQTDEDIIAWFIDRYNNKYGVRQEVEEILRKYYYL